MATTDEALRPGEARSDGPTVQELLAQETRPVPAVLEEESYEYLGSERIPKERYTSREWHDREVERVWKRVWQMACREEEIPNPGDSLVYEVADISLVVVRTPGGQIKAFHNVCLHRGTTLRNEDGNVTQLRCPFHGFTWDLDGNLASVPCRWDFPHVDPAEYHLPEALVDTWGGWVFVNVDRGAEPLRAYMGAFPDKFPWRHEDLCIQTHVVKVLRCNWKVALEAFIESFHVIATHPQLLPTLGDANTQYDIWPGETRWNRMITAQGVPSPHLKGSLDDQAVIDAVMETFIGPGASFPLPEGTSARTAMANLMRMQVDAAAGREVECSDSEAVDAIEYYVFPNFVPWGGYSRINYRFRPFGNDPDMCLMDVILLFPFNEQEGRPPVPETVVLGPDDNDWNVVPELGPLAAIYNQDTANLPRVQRGLHAMTVPGVTLGNYQESRIRHYHQELCRWVEA